MREVRRQTEAAGDQAAGDQAAGDQAAGDQAAGDQAAGGSGQGAAGRDRETAAAVRGPRGLRRLVVVLLLVVLAAVSAWAGAWAVLWLRERPLETAERLLESGEVAAALEATREFLQRHPEHSRAAALRARALVAAGSPAEAIELFDRVGPATAEELHALARAHLMQQQWTLALPLLVRFLQMQPDDPDGLYEITACRVQLGLLSEALVTAERFAGLPGHEPRGLVFVGTIHSDLGNHAEAAEAYGRVLEFAPRAENLQVTAADFLLEYARTLLAAGRPEQAVPQLERCLQTAPTAEAWLLLGNARDQLGQSPEAAKAWETAVEMDHTYLAAREALANAALGRGDAKEALQWLAPLVAHPQLEASTAYLFQRAHAMQRDEEAAGRWAARVRELREREKRNSAIHNVLLEAPHSFWAKVIRAHKFAESGNWLQAESILRALERDQPADPFFRDLSEAVRRRGPLPSLDQLPIQQF